MLHGSIERREGKTGVTFKVRVDLPGDPRTGKRRQTAKTFRTEPEAQHALQTMLHARDRQRGDQLLDAQVAALFGRKFTPEAKQHARKRKIPTRARDRVLAQLVKGWGWRPGNPGENRVIHALHTLGITPGQAQQQFALGPYTLDFAWVRERIALEADGWVHGHVRAKGRDETRDAVLQAWGWTIHRIDTQLDDQQMQEAVAEVIGSIPQGTCP